VITDIEICPKEKGKKLKWKVTNNGTCTEVVTLDGAYDPKLTLTTVGGLGNNGGEIQPGASLEGEIDVTCAEDSPDGTGEYTIKVNVDPLGVVSTIKGKVVVLPPLGSITFMPFLDATGRQIQPSAEQNDILRLPYVITNNGKCTETFTWDIVSDNQYAHIGGMAGGVQSFNPGQQEKFEAIVTISALAKRGDAIILGTLTARGNEIARDATHLKIVVCDKDSPPIYTVKAKDEPAVCIGASRPNVITFSNISDCPATIVWEAAKKSGKPDVGVTSDSGSYTVSIPKFKSVDVPITITVPPTSLAGDAVINIKSVDQYGSIKHSKFSVSAYKLTETSHNKDIFSKWSNGATARIKIKVDGSHKDNKFKYELVNLEKQQTVQWSTESNALSADAPISEPGRYLVRASDGVRTISASPVFTSFKITFSPKGQSEFKWDDNKSLDAQWRDAESLTEQATEQADNGVKALDAATAYGSAVDANVTAAKQALEVSVENLEASETSLQQAAVDAGLERNAAQNAVDAAAGTVANLEKSLASVTEQIREIEQTYSQPYSSAIRQKLSSLRGTVKAINQQQLPEAKGALRIAKAALAPLLEKVATIQEAIAYTTQRLATLRAGIARFTTLLEGTGEMVEKFKALKAQVSAMSKAAGEASIKLNRLVDGIKIPGFKVPALPVIGTVIDIIQVIQLFQETENLKTSLAKLDEIGIKYKAELDKLTVTRKGGPLIDKVTVQTIPGRLPLSFREEAASINWKTKESPIAGRAVEAAWDWRHMVLIEGDEANYDRQFYSDGAKSGELTLSLYAYGNLGTSSLLIDVSDKKTQAARQLISTGLTEKEMLDAAEIKFSDQTNEWERVKHNVKAISTALTAGLGLGALVLLAIGSTLAAPAALVAAIVGIVAILVGIFVNWLSVSPFAKSIITNYPAANT